MSTYSAIYRATVYQPKSTSATETAVLVPAAGAVHSDAFKIASAQGVAGFQPFLDTVHGRKGTLDISSRNTDVGQLTLRTLDKRTTVGGTNLQRWMTAFLGDALGAPRWIGRKVYVEESTDGGSTWHDHFTGRITKATLTDRTWYELTLQDMSVDLEDVCFTTQPHPTASYAQGPQILPVGLAKDWGAFTATPALQGTFTSAGVGIEGGSITVSKTAQSDLLTMLTAATWPLLGGAVAEHVVYETLQAIKVLVDVTWSGGSGTYRLVGYRTNARVTYGGAWQSMIWYLDLYAIDPTAPGYHTKPPNGAVSFRVYPVKWTPSEKAPLYIGDVHPVTLLKHLCDGYFGELNTDGTPRRAFPRKNPTGAAGDPFYDLEQDLSFTKVRYIVPEKAEKRIEWIRTHLLPGAELSLVIGPDGKAFPVDLRARATVGSLVTLTSADLATKTPPKWSHTKDGAVSRIDSTFYVDRQRPVSDLDYWGSSQPDVSTGLIESGEVPTIELNVSEHSLDANGKTLKLDLDGYRYADGEAAPLGAASTTQSRRQWLDRRVAQITAAFRRLFGAGPMETTLVCQRNVRTDAIAIGTYALLHVDELPDPATNLRGGQRVGLCTSREEDGPTVALGFLDYGSSQASLTPTITMAANAIDGAHAVDVTVTLNADQEPVSVQYVVTETAAVSAPADTDAGWTNAFTAETSGTTTITGLPSGKKVWIRGQTTPFATSGLGLTSSTVYSSPASVTLSTITGPTAGAVSSITASTAHLAWTNANTNDPVDVFLIQSASAPADWTETYRVATLPAGSTQYDLSSLVAAVGSSYTWRARCRDSSGGVSAGTGTTFVTTSTTITAPTPGVPTVNSSGGLSVYDSLNAGVGFKQQKPPTGISLTLHPADPAYDLELQRTTDSGGAPNAGAWATIAATIPGASPRYFDNLPLTGAIYWYRCRETGLGATASDWTAAVSGTAQRYYGDTLAREARRRTDTLYQSDAVLGPTVAAQRDTGSPTKTFLTKGLRSGTCRHNAAVTFTPAFAGTPVVFFGDGRRDQNTAGKWGTITQVNNGTTAANRTAADVYALKTAQGLTASGFTPQLLFRQKGTTTQRLSDGSGTPMTAAGATDVSASLANAPAAGDAYTVRGRGSISATSGFGSTVSLDVIVALEYRLSTGGTYTEIWRTPSPFSVSDNTSTTQTLAVTLSVAVTVANMTTTGDFRWKIISATRTGSGTTSLSIRGDVVATDGAGQAMVVYYTASGDQYASMTPDADDTISWYAMEGS